MNRRTALTLLGASAASPLALGFPLRARAQATAGRTLTYGQSGAVNSLDPAQGAFTTYPAGYEVAYCLYDRLVDFDENLKFVPQLAEAWDVAPDLKSIRFRLRKNVRFHDGTPFNAQAVKFNVERLIDKARNPTNRPLWDPVAGADVVDEHTVVIRTKAPFSQLLNSLAHGSGSLVSPRRSRSTARRGSPRTPSGPGPTGSSRSRPVRRSRCGPSTATGAGSRPTDRLVFKYILEASTRIAALRTGSVDVIDSVPVQLVAGLRREANLDVLVRPSLRPMGLAINLSRPPYDDPRVRRALNHAIPVETIAERVFFGFAKASDSPLAFDTQGYQKQRPYEYSVAKAKALLAEAGFKPGAGGQLERDGKPLKMTLLASDGLFPGDVSIAEIAQRAFQQVGIDVTISKIERGSYWDALRQERAALAFDLAVFGFNPSNASGLYHLESLFKSNADDAARPTVWNMGRYRNPKVDELLAQANTNPDPAKQREAMGEAQRIVWEDAPYVWLHVNQNVTAVRKGVKGVELWPIVFTIARRARVEA